MDIIINTKIAKKADLNLSEVMTLYKLEYMELDYLITLSDLRTLEEKKFLKLKESDENMGIVLRSSATELLESMQNGIELNKTKNKNISKRTLNQIVSFRIKEYRSKWKGLKRGAMGSPTSCEEKLIRWIKNNPEYTFDDILKAADLYIDSLNGDYTYLQRADYFIYKKEGKEESSRLSAFIEEINTDMVDSDWTSNLN